MGIKHPIAPRDTAPTTTPIRTSASDRDGRRLARASDTLGIAPPDSTIRYCSCRCPSDAPSTLAVCRLACAGSADRIGPAHPVFPADDHSAHNASRRALSLHRQSAASPQDNQSFPCIPNGWRYPPFAGLITFDLRTRLTADFAPPSESWVNALLGATGLRPALTNNSLILS